MDQRAFPTYLLLPEGRAELIHGSLVDGTPRYQISGVELDPATCDTRIPLDLLNAGWFWWGSSLCWRNEAAGNQACLFSITGPRPIDDYYEQARIVERIRAKNRPAFVQEALAL